MLLHFKCFYQIQNRLNFLWVFGCVKWLSTSQQSNAVLPNHKYGYFFEVKLVLITVNMH